MPSLVAIVLPVALACVVLLHQDAFVSAKPRSDYLVNLDWRFLLNATCDQCAETGFDDSAWRHVAVPHDFIHEQEFDPTAPEASGFLPPNVGFYRRTLSAPAVFDAGAGACCPHAFSMFSFAHLDFYLVRPIFSLSAFASFRRRSRGVAL